MSFPEWSNGQQNPEVPVNEGFDILKYAAVYGRDPETTAGLTWGWIGTSNESPTPTLDAYYWSGFLVTEGTQTLSNNATTYMTVARSTGVPNFSTSITNWNDSTNYARVFKLVTSGGQVVQIEDYRAGDRGIFGSSAVSSGSQTQAIIIACGDESTALTTGTNKVRFRMPYAFTLQEVRASVNTAPTGANLVVDINEGGASILSTKLSIDATETTSTTAATPPVISDTSLADDAEISIDIDQIGSTIAGAGLKVSLIGVKT